MRRLSAKEAASLVVEPTMACSASRRKTYRQKRRPSFKDRMQSTMQFLLTLIVLSLMPKQVASFHLVFLNTASRPSKKQRTPIKGTREYTHRATDSLGGFSVQEYRKRNRTSSEMVAMTGLGAFLSLALVFSLATSTKETTQSLDVVTENVLDAMLPSTASDLVSVTVGEALAGIIGAASTFVLALVVNNRKNDRARSNIAKDALAEGDFFLASAAAFPLVQSLGLSPVVSSVITSVFASVPYELVKYGSRRREQRTQEDKILEELLEEQQSRPRKAVSLIPGVSLFVSSLADKDAKALELIELENKLDVVEIFSDLLRWLAYGILMTDFGGSLSLIPGVESAIYGVLATLSSQAYGDLLYGVFGFGGERKRDLVRLRSTSDWLASYLSRALYAAT
jgi:hypothetical protein